MTASAVVEEVRRRGVKLRVSADGERLEFAPASKVPPELVEQLRQHKPEIMRSLASHEPVVESEAEARDMAHQRFGEPDPAPVPPLPPGTDPMVHIDSDKARFFTRGDWRRCKPYGYRVHNTL